MNNKKLKPTIRYKGYTDLWEQRKYFDIGVCVSGGTLSYNSLVENGVYKCVLYGDLYTIYDTIINNITRRTNNRGNTIYRNDVLFPQSTTVDAYSLISPGCLNEETAETSGVFVIRPHKNVDGNFVAYYTKGNNSQRNKLAKNAQGLTIVHLYYNSIKDETIMLPCYEEQKKISKIFMNIDNLITLHQRKLEKAQNLKKAMLEKMFPKSGELVPEIRFTGFSGSWEQRKLGDVLSFLKDGTHGTHADSKDGPLLLSAKNIKNGTVQWDETDRRIAQCEYEKIHSTFSLESGDVLLTIVGSIGETAILRDSIGVTFQRSVAFLRPDKCLNSEFLYSEIQTAKFQKELENRKSTSAQPGIYLGDLTEVPVSFPSNIEEQVEIGKFFGQLENAITLHQCKLDKLQNFKKAMLQKMFV